MIKKLSIISLVVLLAALVVGALIAPIAVGDVAKATGNIDANYAPVREQLVIPATGVKTVSFDNGNYIQTVKLHPSPDGDIHVYSDGYTEMDSQFSYALDHATGHLEVGRYLLNNWKSLSWLSRENLPILLARGFNSETPCVELYLPAGVAYDMDSWRVGETFADPGVETYYARSTGDYNQLTETEEGLLTDETSQAAQEQSQVLRDLAAESDELLLSLCRRYAADGDEALFWQNAEPLIGSVAAAYAQRAAYADGLGQWRDMDLETAIFEYMYWVCTQTRLDLEELRLERAYHQGGLTKTDYYAADLANDDAEQEAEDNLEAREELHDLLENIQEMTGAHSLLVDGFEPETLDF